MNLPTAVVLTLLTTAVLLPAQSWPFDLGPAREAVKARAATEAEMVGLTAGLSPEIQAAAADDAALDRWLANDPREDEVFAVLRLRSAAVDAARRRLEAALLIYEQPDALEELSSRYRSFDLKGAAPRAGQARAAFAADPRVLAIWGENAQMWAEMAWIDLRREGVDQVAAWIESSARFRATEGALPLVQARIALIEELELGEEKAVATDAGSLGTWLKLRQMRLRQELALRTLRSERDRLRIALNSRLHREPDAPLKTVPVPLPMALRSREALASLADALELDPALHEAHMTERRAKISWRHAALAKPAPAPDETEKAALLAELETAVQQAGARHIARAAEVGRQVAALHASLLQSLDTLETLDRDLLPLARRRLEAERGAYSAGKSSLREVTEALTGLFEIEDERLRAESEQQLDRAQLLRLTGQR